VYGCVTRFVGGACVVGSDDRVHARRSAGVDHGPLAASTASIDRSRVEVRGIGVGPAPASDPLYTVAYVAPSGATILFALGPTPNVVTGDSAIGTRVRNSGAALIYVGGWPATSGAVVTRKVRWIEGNHVMRIESDRFSGDDLLHVAWSLDPTGAPPPKNPYTRAKPGVCAPRGGAPEQTVQSLIGLIGSGDRDAVLDCFALELLGEYPGYGWADLPRASDVKLQPSWELGGRIVVGAGWLFASDPGGALGAASASLLHPRARGRELAGVRDGDSRVPAPALGLLRLDLHQLGEIRRRLHSEELSVAAVELHQLVMSPVLHDLSFVQHIDAIC
jgi:hypothetical protein